MWLIAAMLCLALAPAALAENPKYGGTLNYGIAAKQHHRGSGPPRDPGR
jgi:hypothetical protein